MKLKDILPNMTKLYLQRTFNSIIRDARVDSEEEMREVILRNAAEFQNEDRVTKALDFLEDSRDIEVLNELILLCLLESQSYLLSGSELATAVEELENAIISDSRDDNYINTAIPTDARRIYSAVLAAAWDKDDSLNAHEKNVLEVLRTELKLTRRHHMLLESRVGRFPQDNNQLHTHQQIDDSLRDLQVRGLVLRFKTDAEYFVIPQEIVGFIRYQKGRELKATGYTELLNSMNIDQLKRIIASFDLPVSGPKQTLVSRIQRFDILPSVSLAMLSSSELTELLRKLGNVAVSGSKDEKIKRLIDSFEHLATQETSDPTDHRAPLYDSFELLAARSYDELRSQGVIEKDLDIEHYFEQASRYLFEKKLGVSVENLGGSARSDGRVKIDSRDVLLWDNKSTETEYLFPEEHLKQFLNYIRSDQLRVRVFLVIVNSYGTTAIQQAQKLKAYSGEADTDVALITAADLKKLAEAWPAYSQKKTPQFNLQVFNLTGALTWEVLQARMSWAL